MPYEHARLYHSTALLLPDGRVMVGGGGAPGPRNYTDVEYYSPSYLFDGNTAGRAPGRSPAIPKKIGYDGTFAASQADGPISRVTLVRNGSVTHGFNNDQNFQDLAFTQTGGNLTITAPQDGTYAPPGAYMLFVFDADGTPSVAKIVDIDPTVEDGQPRPAASSTSSSTRASPPSGARPTRRRSSTSPPATAGWPRGRSTAPVQLVRSTAASQGGIGVIGYHLGLGADGQPRAHAQGPRPGPRVPDLAAVRPRQPVGRHRATRTADLDGRRPRRRP